MFICINTFFRRAFALQHSSRNCYPAPHLIFWRLHFPCVFVSGEVFFSQTLVRTQKQLHAYVDAYSWYTHTHTHTSTHKHTSVVHSCTQYVSLRDTMSALVSMQCSYWVFNRYSFHGETTCVDAYVREFRDVVFEDVVFDHNNDDHIDNNSNYVAPY